MGFTNNGTMTIEGSQCFFGEVYNYGTFEFFHCGLINVGMFHLMPTGLLNINGLEFYGNKMPEPEMIKFMERNGGKIIPEDGSILFKGKFNVNPKDGRKIFPNLFRKYDYESTKSNYEIVSSTSKVTGQKKFWRYSQISKEYDLKTAARDVFSAQVRNRLLDCYFVTKAKFDVFSKGVVTREFNTSDSNICKSTTSAANSNKRDHELLNHLYVTLISADIQTVNSILSRPLITAREYRESQESYFTKAFKGFKLFFGVLEIATPKMEATSQDGHSYNAERILIDITKSELAEALTEVIMLISNDEFKILSDVKQCVLADFEKDNCKFTSQEIEGEIIPEINLVMENVRQNIEEAKNLLAELEQGILCDNSQNNMAERIDNNPSNIKLKC